KGARAAPGGRAPGRSDRVRARTMSALRVLVMAGSARTGSFNRQLAGVAAGLLGAAGAEVTLVDLRTLDLPLFDADIEARGIPAGGAELRRLFAQTDALVVATPEYNSFVPPLLINSFA